MADTTQTIALEILQANIKLPPFPPVGSQLLALNRQPVEDIDMDKFVRLLESDMSLATHLLQFANSTYFGAIQKISSLRQAILHIGLKESMNTINMHFFRTVLPDFPNIEGFSGKDFWAHSWACGMANRMLGRPDLHIACIPGELYIAGLLHGIGKLILAMTRREEFVQCLENSRNYNQPLFEAELDLIGTTNTDIAYEILKSWQLPQSICMAVKHYRAPEKADMEFWEIAAVTQFAYFIANTSGVGNAGDLYAYDLEKTLLGRDLASPLGDEETRNRVIHDIYETLRKKYAALSDGQDMLESPKSSGDGSATRRETWQEPSSPKPTTGWISRFLQFFK